MNRKQLRDLEPGTRFKIQGMRGKVTDQHLDGNTTVLVHHTGGTNRPRLRHWSGAVIVTVMERNTNGSESN